MSTPAVPCLSIVIPTLNTRVLTLACVASIVASRPPFPTEVIVVDDGSTDGTSDALAEEFPAVHVESSQGGLGFTRAVNLGLRLARGRYCLLLNSDTEVDGHGLAALVAAFEADQGLGIAGGRLVYPDGRPQWSGGARPGGRWLFALASGLPSLLRHLPGYGRVRQSRSGGAVDWVSGAALALRRELLDTLGPLDESFRFYVQDLEFCLRARTAGWKVAVVPEFRVVHHHGSTIRRREGAANLPFQPATLWPDLVAWAAKEGGAKNGRACARILRWGTRLRLLGRALAQPFASDRLRWRAESAAYRQALRQLRPSA